MAGTVKHAKLESRTARSRLKRGRQPHWQALVPGKVHLGYQCWKGDAVGRWVCCGATSATTSTAPRHWAAPTMQLSPMAKTCSALSKPKPRAAMAGVPLLVVAKNLGHADTRMVEKHYGHLATELHR
jgi:hypothetical protein